MVLPIRVEIAVCVYMGVFVNIDIAFPTTFHDYSGCSIIPLQSQNSIKWMACWMICVH